MEQYFTAHMRLLTATREKMLEFYLTVLPILTL